MFARLRLPGQLRLPLCSPQWAPPTVELKRTIMLHHFKSRFVLSTRHFRAATRVGNRNEQPSAIISELSLNERHKDLPQPASPSR